MIIIICEKEKSGALTFIALFPKNLIHYLKSFPTVVDLVFSIEVKLLKSEKSYLRRLLIGLG